MSANETEGRLVSGRNRTVLPTSVCVISHSSVCSNTNEKSIQIRQRKEERNPGSQQAIVENSELNNAVRIRLSDFMEKRQDWG